MGRALSFEVHHIIPINVLNNNKELQRILHKFNSDGFNDIDNAIPLQKKSLKFDQAGHSFHPKYDKFLEDEINKILDNPRLDDLGKFEEIQELISDVKKKLVNMKFLDFFPMGTYLNDDIISEHLKSAIESMGITGFEFSELDYEVVIN